MIRRVSERVSGAPVHEAVDGWCPVDCEGVFKTFMLCMFLGRKGKMEGGDSKAEWRS